MSLLALGIDIGGTNTKIGIVDSDGKILDAHHFPTESHKPIEDFLDRLALEINQILETKNYPRKEMKAGIGVPNYSSHTGEILNPPNLKWGTVPFKKLIEEKIPFEVFIENDANVAAVSEKLWGAGKNSLNFCVITVGTGIGSGIFCNNQLVTGHTGLASEAGHLILQPDGRKCGCGGQGHFETYCSVTGIKKTVEEIYQKPLHYSEILELFSKNDERVLQAYDKTARYFAIGIEQISVLFSPKKIILAGGGMVAGPKFLDMIKSKIKDYAFPTISSTVELSISKLSVEHGAVQGAAALAFFNE
ncbi:MAG: ROK family protein [Halobacteriovoraceae bacterium]|nr:ROK family protein [Halobacteriovoraceae bacterium]MCB9094062.1 ROK family protein [Halobacteriovoraceae bacterium]